MGKFFAKLCNICAQFPTDWRATARYKAAAPPLVLARQYALSCRYNCKLLAVTQVVIKMIASRFLWRASFLHRLPLLGQRSYIRHRTRGIRGRRDCKGHGRLQSRRGPLRRLQVRAGSARNSLAATRLEAVCLLLRHINPMVAIP